MSSLLDCLPSISMIVHARNMLNEILFITHQSLNQRLSIGVCYIGLYVYLYHLHKALKRWHIILIKSIGVGPKLVQVGP